MRGLLVGWLVSLTNMLARILQGLIWADRRTCYHTETKVADQTYYHNQLQYTDTGPTSPSADPIARGA